MYLNSQDERLHALQDEHAETLETIEDIAKALIKDVPDHKGYFPGSMTNEAIYHWALETPDPYRKGRPTLGTDPAIQAEQVWRKFSAAMKTWPVERQAQARKVLRELYRLRGDQRFNSGRDRRAMTEPS